MNGFDYEPFLDAFDLPGMSREELAAYIESVPPHLGIRGAFLKTIPPTMKQFWPEALPRYQAFAKALPPAPIFGFVPMRRLLVDAGYAAHICLPELGLAEAVNSFIEHGMGDAMSIPIMNPIFAACENDLETFMKVLSETQGLLYNQGEILFERVGRKRIVMHYEELPPNVMACITTGYWLGVLRHFGAPEGQVSFEAYGPMQSASEIVW